mmetsp:Transcript_20720/g.37187  ORF Transcript_20720/g.37187 Transcript_20720/m.37187 type:complete len:359 (-) Transcript_20720:180-1256(-)|eukprot:CAMPEP_0201600454 /NCGR_PEP_ID=MMETSP0492-20130828/1495_1 /ASSEMBLY_ACC=CAM_ASM_000837 /TAXON_ID=420259 /ORGANISM="Thalassiosira gravida, Strain GMp14c1" /LENGTH=358 /DNA_ID=CAMNT_0048063191 /DNA_START=129 /DNA_END=1205 /DNA_ORIENTATION=-
MTMRNINIGFFMSLFLLGECITKGEGAVPSVPALPLRRIPLPFLRGGSSATITTSTAARTTKKKRPRQPGVNPIHVVAINNVKEGLGKVGKKIQHDASTIGKNATREWGKLTSNTRKFIANIPKLRLPLPPLGKKRKRKNLKSSCKKLDDVCHTFSSVLRKSNNEVDTAQLLKACRAHLAFMKTGGSSLRLVAKDLESNVHKAEKAFKKSPKEGKSLSSLLQCEKNKGMHKGDELHEKSAAMGLLWIRRSLAFQLDLYASFITGGVHPRDAAYGAYDEHLSPYHGWALRKVFPASLAQMPERRVFIAKFGGIAVEELDEEFDRAVVKRLKALVNMWDPLIRCWEEKFEVLGLEDTRRV